MSCSRRASIACAARVQLFLAFPPVAAGEGGLVCAHYCRTTQPLQLWRTYQSRVPSSRIRRWWNFAPPFAGESVAEWRVLDDVRDWITPGLLSLVRVAGSACPWPLQGRAQMQRRVLPREQLAACMWTTIRFAECGTPHKLGTGIGKDDTQFVSSGQTARWASRLACR